MRKGLSKMSGSDGGHLILKASEAYNPQPVSADPNSILDDLLGVEVAQKV